MQLHRINAYTSRIEQDSEMVVPATVYTSAALPLEQTALAQLRDAACLPPARRVVATPDIHQGYGVPIGSIVALEDAVMPAAVGYDVNCGMRLLRTDIPARDADLERLARSLARDIPLGEGKSNLHLADRDLQAVLAQGLPALSDIAARSAHPAFQAFDAAGFRADLAAVECGGALPGDPAAVPAAAIEKGGDQLGTLGGGNHFIELQVVDRVLDARLAERFGLAAGDLTVMIHSGSRRLGYETAAAYMRIAREANAPGARPHLEYLPAAHPAGRRYIDAMNAAGNFAYVNRQIMTLHVRRCLRHEFGAVALPLIYDVSHNMAQLEDHDAGRFWVHRKGATRAFGPRRMAGTAFADSGQPVIIPGSMGTASYLLVGADGAEAALASVNHGAGRTMSRTAAAGKRRGRSRKSARPAAISDEDFRRSMKGIILIAADRGAIKEEAPAAYKDIDAVIDVVVQAGLAHPVVRLRPLAVLKG